VTSGGRLFVGSGAARFRFLISLVGAEPGRSPDIHTLDRAGTTHVAEDWAMVNPPAPKQWTRQSRWRGLPNRGSVGSGGNLVTTAAADVHRASRGFTRMSLAGYSSAGWSPPEPASASPAQKRRITWIDLHAW